MYRFLATFCFCAFADTVEYQGSIPSDQAKDSSEPMAFKLSYLKKKDKKSLMKDVGDQPPPPKRARTVKSPPPPLPLAPEAPSPRVDPSIVPRFENVPGEQQVASHEGETLEIPPPPARHSASGSGTESGASSRQSLESSSELAWQKLLATVTDVELTAVRRDTSSAMVYEHNHEFFKVMTRSLALYHRLGGTENALGKERKKNKALILDFEARQKELLAKVEEAKDNVVIAQSEREGAIRQNRELSEENRKLGNERNGLWRELNDIADQKVSLEKRVTELEKEAQDAGRRAIEEFKASDDYQEALLPAFMQGFKNALGQIKISFPEIDISGIEPSEVEPDGGEEEEENGAVGEKTAEGSGAARDGCQAARDKSLPVDETPNSGEKSLPTDQTSNPEGHEAVGKSLA